MKEVNEEIESASLLIPMLERVITIARPGKINRCVYCAPASQRKPKDKGEEEYEISVVQPSPERKRHDSSILLQK